MTIPQQGKTKSPLGRPDYVLLGTVAVLLALGLNMVYSASFVLAHNSPLYKSDTYFLVRQLMWVGLGTVAMLVTMRVDYHRWRRFTVPVVVLMLLALAGVLLPGFGHSVYGAQRWLRIGPLPPLQPSEFAKLALILYYADWLASRREQSGNLSRSLGPFVLTLGGTIGLVMLQPDVGTTAVIGLTAVSLYFVAGADLKHLVSGLVLGAAAFVPVVLAASYRWARIVAFLDPERDPLGIGWQTIQSNIALGSGGIFGLGLGASRQKFYYLPNAHTDAIFAIIGEELGLVGCLAVVGLFALLAYRGYKIATQAPDAFGALLATGVTCGLVFQALINVAVVTATVPFTGIPLPFLSFGGSSVLVSMASVGLLLNISRQRVTVPRIIRRRRPAGAPAAAR